MRHALLAATLALPLPAAATCAFTDAALTAPPLTGDSAGAADDVTPSCQPSTGADLTFAWTAPATGRYHITTSDLSDTVLVLTDAADCATELACDDDGGPGRGAQLDVELVGGVTYLITVDSWVPAPGDPGGAPFELDVTLYEPAVCPTAPPPAAATMTGTTCGAGDDLHGASCGAGAWGEDASWRWAPPSSGVYTFSTAGSALDTVLTVHDAADCDVELACSDDVARGITSSEVSMSLDAGQEVLITVDGYGLPGTTSCGDYTLTVRAGCPDADRDGRCDAHDACRGDDATGDSDFDGVCDDRDFTLTLGASNPAPGASWTLSVDHAPARADVVFLLGASAGVGPCHPSGVCADVVAPRVLGQRSADASGRASLTLRVPANAPPGAEVFVQAAWVGAGGDVTEVEAWAEPTWRVGGKQFAMFDTYHHGSPHLSLWIPAAPGAQAALIEADPARFWRPPYVGHRGWVAIVVDDEPPWDMIASLVAEAYRLVAPARVRR